MTKYELYDDKELLTAFSQNDNIKAFEEIYKRYWEKLYGWAYNITASKEEAEEMVQSVFEKLWKNRQHTTIQNLGMYLAVSIRNIYFDLYRRNLLMQKFKQARNNESISNLTEDTINHKLLMEVLDDTLKTLPAKTQTVFRLSRYDNRSVKEIADFLHLTEKAVEYHITKALKIIRHRLKEYLPLLFF